MCVWPPLFLQPLWPSQWRRNTPYHCLCHHYPGWGGLQWTWDLQGWRWKRVNHFDLYFSIFIVKFCIFLTDLLLFVCTSCWLNIVLYCRNARERVKHYHEGVSGQSLSSLWSDHPYFWISQSLFPGNLLSVLYTAPHLQRDRKCLKEGGKRWWEEESLQKMVARM